MDLDELEDEVERKNAIARDNKRRVMRSNIFVGDDSNTSVPVSYQPKYNNAEKPKAKKMNNPDNNNYNRDKFPTIITQPPTYQSNDASVSTYHPKSYPKQSTIAVPLVDNSPINIPPIEAIENPPSLPTLTPFPDFQFETVSPVCQIDFDIKPRGSISSLTIQNEKILNPVVFNIGNELQKIRESLIQDSSNNSKVIQQILASNNNSHLDIEPIKLPNTTTPFNNNNNNNLNNSQSEKLPQMTTTSQFILPDETVMEN